MSINPLTIYLWQLADNISGPATALSIISGIAAVVMFIILIVNTCNVGYYGKTEDTPRYAAELGTATTMVEFARPWLHRMLCVFLLSIGINVFVPSSNTIAMMLIIPKIADSKILQQDIPDVYNAAIAALKAKIIPTLPEVKK